MLSGESVLQKCNGGGMNDRNQDENGIAVLRFWLVLLLK
jgi:hypothetical protein